MGLVGPAGVAPVATPASRLMALSVHLRRLASPLQRYVAIVSIASVSALALLVVLDGRHLVGEIDLALICLSLLAVGGEFVRIRVFRRGAEGEITLSTAFSFAVLLAGGALAGCIVLGTASAAADLAARKPASRVWFNAAQYVLSMAAAAIALAVLSGTPLGTTEPLVASELPSVVIAAAVFFGVNSVLVAVVIALSRGYSVMSYFRTDFAFVAASAGLALGLAPIAVLAANFSPLLVPALALPLIGVHRAARQAMELEHQSLHDSLTGTAEPRPPASARGARAGTHERGGRSRGRAADRPRPLQGDQRHARAPRTATSCCAGRATRLAAAAARRRHRRAAGRRRVRRRARACRRRPPSAVRLAESLRSRIDEPIDIDGVVMRTEASIGVAVAPDARRATSTRCCAARTSRCTSPRAAASASPCTTARRSATAPRGWRSPASCGARSSSGELTLHYQPQGRRCARASCGGRGARALAAPEPRARRARRVRPARREHRPDRTADDCGARARGRAGRAPGDGSGVHARRRRQPLRAHLLDRRLPDDRRRPARAPRRRGRRASSSRSPRA